MRCVGAYQQMDMRRTPPLVLDRPVVMNYPAEKRCIQERVEHRLDSVVKIFNHRQRVIESCLRAVLQGVVFRHKVFDVDPLSGVAERQR